MKNKNELGGCGTFAVIVYVSVVGIIAVIWIIVEGIPYVAKGFLKGLNAVETRVGPTVRRITNESTLQDLRDDYYHGMKTPKGWDAGEWYKYKTETPGKALRYLDRLAMD